MKLAIPKIIHKLKFFLENDILVGKVQLEDGEWYRCSTISSGSFIGVWNDLLYEIFITENGFVYYRDDYRPVSVSLSRGYVLASIIKNGQKYQIKVHRLVGNAFVSNPDKSTHYQINHIDGNKQNNYYTNLEWCTSRHNNIHALMTGLRTRKFSDFEINEIRKLSREYTFEELGQKYGVSSSTINYIVQNKGYVDPLYQPVPKNKTGENHGRALLTNGQVNQIRTLYPEYTTNQLAELFNVRTSIIRNILKNKIYIDSTFTPFVLNNNGKYSSSAKFTPLQIKEIRQNYPMFNTTQLSKKYNVDSETIRSIVKYKTYKNI